MCLKTKDTGVLIFCLHRLGVFCFCFCSASTQRTAEKEEKRKKENEKERLCSVQKNLSEHFWFQIGLFFSLIYVGINFFMFLFYGLPPSRGAIFLPV